MDDPWPLLYRLRFTNWLLARPWRIRHWNYRAIWRGQRITAPPLVSLWRTIGFPTATPRQHHGSPSRHS